jgi:hypothetical protein
VEAREGDRQSGEKDREEDRQSGGKDREEERIETREGWRHEKDGDTRRMETIEVGSWEEEAVGFAGFVAEIGGDGIAAPFSRGFVATRIGPGGKLDAVRSRVLF